jgi:hypothetical protein
MNQRVSNGSLVAEVVVPKLRGVVQGICDRRDVIEYGIKNLSSGSRLCSAGQIGRSG